MNQLRLVTKPTFSFAGLNFKRKPTKRDLEHYELVITGCNLGSVFGKHFDKETHGHHTTMQVLKENVNQQYAQRMIYEQQRIKKTDYLRNAKTGINQFHAHSENVGLKEIHPEDNYVVLENNRRINYNYLVVALGLKPDYQLIKGFEDAWKDLSHPVFSNNDHMSWRSLDHKYQKFIYNFTSGDAYFCIPPYPFAGEIEGYNFLLAKNIWNWYEEHGRLSPKHTFTIMNANERFSQWLETADQTIKDLISKAQIKVEYNVNLVEVDKQNQTATFQNTKTGVLEKRDYNNLYAMAPSQKNQILVDSGLASKNGLLDVDHHTLQHNKYDNIFGLGDCCDLPTTRTFWGGFRQISVVRHNLNMLIKGKQLNAKYDGYTKTNLILGQNKMTRVSHCYDQKENQFNLLGANGGIMALLQYYAFVKKTKGAIPKTYDGKNWGPPYYKMKLKWSEVAKEEEEETKKVVV